MKQIKIDQSKPDFESTIAKNEEGTFSELLGLVKAILRMGVKPVRVKQTLMGSTPAGHARIAPAAVASRTL
jgi:hypothetical protein